MQTLQKQVSSRLLALVLAAFVFLALHGTILALAADITRPFQSSELLPTGTLVSLAEGTEDTVKAANSENEEQLIGVVVSSEDALINIDKTKVSVQVAVSGRANALVSDVYGDIKSGDLISRSPITGVGAKARPGSTVVGVAQADFTSISENTTTTTVNEIGKGEMQATVGSIPVIVSLGQATGGNVDGQFGSGVRGALSDVAGKPVSTTRMIVVSFIIILTLIILTAMIVTATKNGIVALSRNPLAKTVIFEGLAQVLVMIVLVCVISLTLCYAVLRL
jgi:hypothetical protein